MSSPAVSAGGGHGGVASFLQSVGDQVSRSSAFVLSNPPLAALHNMTEMKVPPASAGLMGCGGGNAGGGGNANTGSMGGMGGNAGAASTGQFYAGMSQAALKQMALAGTPHGIQDILSRSHTALAAHYNSLTAGLPRLNLNGAPHYLNSAAVSAVSAAGRFPKPLAELPGRSPIYWPGVLQNPAWRPAGGCYNDRE